VSQADTLIEIAARAVAFARDRGADQAEVFVGHRRETTVELQKDDLHSASTAEEGTFGIRVFKGGAIGFATVNSPNHLEHACEEALAVAAIAPPDQGNGLPEPVPVEPLEAGPDPELLDLQIGPVVDLAASLLERVKARDPRVVVDSGGVSVTVATRAIVTSTGIQLAEDYAAAGGSLFGMAVDGDEVGSFDYDGHSVRSAADLRPQLEAAADRFVVKATGALGATRGESFRGTVVLSPEVVHSFVLDNLMSVLSGRAVRTGKSPLAKKLGSLVAVADFDLVDDGRLTGAAGALAFDREGMPTRALPIIENGQLRSFLYDVYEARAAGAAPTGHARGGAASPPTIGPSNLVLRPGKTPFAQLCAEPERCILVSRFSGSSNAITGEFSGVVKGGFSLRNGERTPIKETLIAGNLYELLKNVSGISREIRDIGGSDRVPALRIEDVSVTAG
jgi:PmbA protein